MVEDGVVKGYKITGRKQWISNGGVAEIYTILAMAPGGPSWFVVEKDAEGFAKNKPEDKHGIRASNTAALFLEDVYVDADRLLGGVEGQGLAQAQAVFGYTRLMVAAFGLGGGWAALKRAIPYSQQRIQGGAPLSEKQGYMDKLIVPNAVRLEASRAYIEWTADRIDDGESDLQTEGAVAKYLATEAGNKAAEDSIQALGGYGYTKEYMVEKYKRDVRITTIYEGTSEIMEWTISRDRWQFHLKTKGAYYNDWAARVEQWRARTITAAPPRLPWPSAPSPFCWNAPPGPPDAQPARPLPPGRIDRLRRDGGHLRRALDQPSHDGAAVQPRDAAGHGPRSRPRRRAQGGGRRPALGHRRRPDRPESGRVAEPACHLCRPGRPAGGHGLSQQEAGGSLSGCIACFAAARRDDAKEPGLGPVYPLSFSLASECLLCLCGSFSALKGVKRMTHSSDRAIAIVGVGAMLPDAPNAPAFWNNIINKRYCIRETPPERWSIADYYDSDPAAPDKSYSKIGGWVRGFQFDCKKYRVPPKVATAMDESQQWAVTIADEALADYGFPNRPLDTDRTGVILGTAMGGELHYITHHARPVSSISHTLEAVPEFAGLPASVQGTSSSSGTPA